MINDKILNDNKMIIMIMIMIIMIMIMIIKMIIKF